MENAAGAEVAAANQRVWLYAEDGVTLIKAATTNANGWVDFGAQPEHFAIAYEVGKQLVYQEISQNPGEVKIVTPFDETVELDVDRNCTDQSVKKTILISGIAEDTDFIARTNHPEWVTKLGPDGKTLTICAARAPADGKFDLWLVSSAGYQLQQNLNWQGASNIAFSPVAPALSNWSITPTTYPILAYNLAITDGKQLPIFDKTEYNISETTTIKLDLPRLTGAYTMQVFARDYGNFSYKITKPLDSLNAIPTLDLPAPSFDAIKWSVGDQRVSWTAKAPSEFDFYELSIQLDNGAHLVTMLDKGRTSFKVPQLPVGFSATRDNFVDLSSVDYRDFSNLVGWQDATQSPLISLEEFVAKVHSAESNSTRVTYNK